MDKTGYNQMITEYREEFEGMIHNSTILLEVLEKNEDEFYLSKYINVLIALKYTKHDYNYILYEINTAYYSSDGHDIDVFMLQKTIKSYLDNSDSTIDYLDKLCSYLKKNNQNVKYIFSRQDDRFSCEISDYRNDVLHEGMVGISFDRETAYDYGNCMHATGSTRTHGVIHIKFGPDNNFKTYQLDEFLKKTYPQLVSLVQTKTNELLDVLTKS